MNNSIAIVKQLVKQLKVPVAASSIKTELEKHPDFPSLLAISDVLRDWGVLNTAYEVSIEDLVNIPAPFLAHVSDGGGKFVIVKSIEGEGIVIINDKREERRISIERFRSVFTGNVLMVMPQKSAGERNYLVNRRRDFFDFLRLPFVIIGSCIVFGCLLFLHSFYLGNFNWQIAILTILKGAGIAVSILLLTQTFDVNNSIVQRFCFGEKKDCNNVLASKAAKVLGSELNWSEVGFLYFTATWLLLLFNTESTALMQLLAIFNILALPYTFYSIYYQAKIARQWCVVCCIVQVLLWLEFVPQVFYLFRPFDFPSVAEWSNVLICFLIPAVLWVFIKPFLLQLKQVKPLKEQLRKFKYNEVLFRKLLAEQPRHELPDEIDSIIVGQTDATKVVTIVTDPFCPPCSKAHRTLELWLEKGDDFKLQIVFSPRERGRQIATHIMALNTESDRSLVLKALSDWYERQEKNYSPWAMLYPINKAEDADNKLKRQEEWCNAIGIEYTPTILINGYKLPQLYQLEDIRFFI